MSTIRNTLLRAFCMTFLFATSFASAQTKEWTREDGKRERARRDAIYERMTRYGINREDVKSLGGGAYVDTGERQTPYHIYSQILAERVLKPGEHYRFELDEYILTMVVPDAVPGQSWIVPYVDTRSEPQRGELLRKSKAGLDVASLMWHYGTGIWPLYFGWEGDMNLYITYNAVLEAGPGIVDISTPEKLQQFSSKRMHSLVPAPTEVDDARRKHMFLSGAGNRVFLDTETVVINGRVWTREALNRSFGRLYKYKTVLLPDRWLVISVFAPQYDYNANPDPSTYPAALKRALAQLEQMMASLRVAKRNDNGAPDPFVVERVEVAPLPVREKLQVH